MAGRRNADVGDHHLAGMLAPRQQQMPVLAPAEGHGRRRSEGTAEHFAGVAVDAARDIDRDAGQIAYGAGFGERQCDALQRPGEACAEQRVDDQRLAIEQRQRDRLDRVLPPVGHGCGIALEPLAGTQETEAHRPAGIGQQPGGDEAVAPVVAGAAKHGDGPRSPAPHDGVRHRTAGVLHQRQPGNAGPRRRRIGRIHLGHGKEGESTGAAHPPSV